MGDGSSTSEAVSIGLLLCDHLDPEVAAQVGDYTELFPAAFEPAGVELTVFETTLGQFPDSPRECDGWIISGSRRSVYEDEGWIHDLEQFTRDIVAAKVPLVGICFGHQMIAQALGGRVGKSGAGWGVGAKTFRIVDATEPVSGESMTMLMSHQDQVLELPDGATVFATSDYCPVGGYRIGDRVLCVQGHPEFVPDLCRILMGRRREIIGDDVVDAGLASLDTPLSHDQVVRWMASTLQR